MDAVSNDLAVEKVLEFVDDDQEDQRDQGHPWRDSEGDADHDRIADEIADDWQQAAKEGETDNDQRITQLCDQDEDGGEGRVNRGDDNLGAHHGGKALI